MLIEKYRVEPYFDIEYIEFAKEEVVCHLKSLYQLFYVMISYSLLVIILIFVKNKGNRWKIL